MPPKMRTYTVVTCASAIALVASLAAAYPVSRWMPVVALMMLNFITENFAFQLPVGGSVSLSFAVTYAALLHSGPLAAVMCALAGSTNIQELREGKPAVLRLFNASQLALSAGLAGIAYVGLGGQSLVDSSSRLVGAPAAAAPVVFFLVNVLLVGYGSSILSGHRLVDTFKEQGFLSYASSLLVLALLGYVMAALISIESWAGLLLLVLPFALARRIFRVYLELTEAYTDTVRSLVSAIEAKDPYTRGHSERVAVYSRDLAESLALPAADVLLVERAALLHDVGKIGVSLATLTSPNRLTSGEVREIRGHPSIGGDLVSQVEFLSEVVPIIRHHHEHYDGGGYPAGLYGEAIPRLARVLAVADAFDAMTSDRAYRPGMAEQDALDELRRVAGTQLDALMVNAFITARDSERAERS